MKNEKLIVILGCTATGKTNVAVNLASQIGGEVISADSRQVYRGMDVGTGKDLSEWVEVFPVMRGITKNPPTGVTASTRWM